MVKLLFILLISLGLNLTLLAANTAANSSASASMRIVVHVPEKPITSFHDGYLSAI